MVVGDLLWYEFGFYQDNQNSSLTKWINKVVGHFDDSAFYRFKNNVLEKSSIAQYFISDRIHHSAKDVALLVAIVDTARKKIIEQYPEIEFHVIYLSQHPDDKFDKMALDGFRQRGIPVHKIEDILPGYFEHPKDYQVGEHEGHPNLKANQLIAQYIVRNIFKEKEAQTIEPPR